MKAEIIAVGTELLLGQVVNTNATFLSEELVGLGYDVYFQTVVGDNKERLLETLAIASQRSELIILCGGLGPTEDDLTRETVASYLKEELVLDPTAYQKMAAYIHKQDREVSANNRRQALTIANGQSVQNPDGLAVGTYYEAQETAYLLLPGPPRELMPMFYKEVVPLLKSKLPQTTYLTSRVLRFFGIGESRLVVELEQMIRDQTNPTIAPYAAPNEVRLRLTVKASDKEKATVLLDKQEAEIQKQVGGFFYGYGEENSLENETVQLLKKNGQTIAVAESLTAGLVQSSLGAIPGVSAVLKGGFVVYTNEMKRALLGISSELLQEFGAVSQECAYAMAENTLQLTGADYALSLTGVAGPDEAEGQSVGTVWIGLASKNEEVMTQKLSLQRDRTYVQHSAMMSALDMLRRRVLKDFEK